MFETTVLRMISEPNLGTEATGLFRKHEDIATELGETNETLQPIIDKLIDEKLIRVINDRFEQVTGNALEYIAYQITELGKSQLLQNSQSTPTVYSGIYGSNIAHNSANVTQTVSINSLTPEIQKKVKEFDIAVKQKDGAAMKKTFGYIADKAVDVAIALGTGALMR